MRSASGESLFRVRVPLPRRVLTWQNGVEDRALVTSVRLHAHGLTTPRRPRALTPSRGRISARGIRGTRALRPLHRLPLRQLRGSVLGLGLASPGRKVAAAAPAITASHDSVQHRKGRKGAKEPSRWLSRPSERKIFTTITLDQRDSSSRHLRGGARFNPSRSAQREGRGGTQCPPPCLSFGSLPGSCAVGGATFPSRLGFLVLLLLFFSWSFWKAKLREAEQCAQPHTEH